MAARPNDCIVRPGQQKEYANYSAGKEHLKSYQSVDTDMGEMLTFGAMVTLYGGWGWQPAVDGAKHTAGKCAKLAGKWIDKDPFSELTRFFVMRKQHAGIFAEKWSEYEKEIADSTKTQAEQPVSAAASSGSASTSSGTAIKQPKRLVSDTGKHSAPAAKVKTEPVSESKMQGIKLLKRASQVKLQIGKHRSAAENLVRTIKSEPSWKWADSDACRGSLDALLLELEGKLVLFAHDFMVLPAKVVEVKYGTRWLVELETFCAIQTLVGHLQKTTDKLTGMHSKSV